MPRGAPGNIAIVRALHEPDVTVDDGRAPMLSPALRLSGLADTGRTEEQDAPALVINGGTVKLQHLATRSVSVEDLVAQYGKARWVTRRQHDADAEVLVCEKDIGAVAVRLRGARGQRVTLYEVVGGCGFCAGKGDVTFRKLVVH